MKEIKIRCSQLGAIVTKPKLKSESLSQTAKTYLRQLYLEREYGYKEEVMTNEMMKGHLCEAQSRELIQTVLGGEFRKRNTEKLENNYINGTPDIVLEQEPTVEDIKNSYNLRTFMDAEPTKFNEWQMYGYMWLTGSKKGRVIYTLNKTPFEIIEDQKRRVFYQFNCEETDEYHKICKQIEQNNELIDNIPPSKRVKVFDFQFMEQHKDFLIEKIEHAREYYKSLEL